MNRATTLSGSVIDLPARLSTPAWAQHRKSATLSRRVPRVVEFIYDRPRAPAQGTRHFIVYNGAGPLIAAPGSIIPPDRGDSWGRQRGGPINDLLIRCNLTVPDRAVCSYVGTKCHWKPVPRVRLRRYRVAKFMHVPLSTRCCYKADWH